MQRVAVLGSTGSIGTNALDIISRFTGTLRVSALSAYSNVSSILEQARKFRPESVCIGDIEKAESAKKILRKLGTKLYVGQDGLCRMLDEMRIDILLVGIVGSSALLPILKALDNIKTLALANKEALVMAGDIIMKKAKKNKVKILPVDSEHSAVFQCIGSRDISDIKRIYLTGSGGPLLYTPKKDFRHITPEEAVNHPRWKMGKKISIDSATLMNKGLEVIEAHHLFGVKINNIEVLIHPEAVVHSMVEFIDGSILAHMGRCDMRSPIQYALTYPARSASPVKELNFSKFRPLEFCLPDFKKFPCLEMAYEAATRGGTAPAVLNGSNEIAVEEFLKRRINFTDIPRVIGKVMGFHRNVKDPALKDILEADKWARIKTKEILDAIGR